MTPDAGSRIAADVEQLRATARQLGDTAGELLDVATTASRTAVSATLLGTLPFSPGTGTAAEKQLLDAALRPGAAAVGLKAVSVELTTRAALFEIASSDRFADVQRGIGEFFGGVWEGTKGLVGGLWSAAKLSPVRLMIDPRGWYKDALAAGKGLLHSVRHPVEFAKALVDWDLWKKNPARAAGKLIPSAVLFLVTRGAGAAGKGAQAGKVADGAPGGGKHGNDPPKSWPAKRPTPSGTAPADPAKLSRHKDLPGKVAYGDTRGKHSQAAHYTARELEEALEKAKRGERIDDPELRAFVDDIHNLPRRDYGSQLGREAYDDYEGLVTRALEEGRVTSRESIVHRAPYDVGIDDSTMRATRCYTMRWEPGVGWHIYPGGTC